jgi:hypothetical protein
VHDRRSRKTKFMTLAYFRNTIRELFGNIIVRGAALIKND